LFFFFSAQFVSDEKRDCIGSRQRGGPESARPSQLRLSGKRERDKKFLDHDVVVNQTRLKGTLGQLKSTSKESKGQYFAIGTTAHCATQSVTSKNKIASFIYYC
jgi:hypothetical protein